MRGASSYIRVSRDNKKIFSQFRWRTQPVYYESLTEALAACLSIKDWVLFSREILPDKMDGISIQVKLMLNHEGPRPISISDFNQSWQLSSGGLMSS